jgi:hypothetical protein
MRSKIFDIPLNCKLIVIIFSIVIISIELPNVDGYLLPKSALEKYLEHDYIILGKVISLEDTFNNFTTPKTTYQIEVLQPIKGQILSEIVEISGLGAKNATRHLDNETIFSDGQKAIFMLNKKTDGSWFISPYTTSSESQNPDSEFILPPLKLFNAGIMYEEIHCKSYLKLGLKTSNLQPVCLKPESFSKLFDRQWIQ